MTKYMQCKFIKRRNVFNLYVKYGDHIITQVTQFKYLGSIVQSNGEIK